MSTTPQTSNDRAGDHPDSTDEEAATPAVVIADAFQLAYGGADDGETAIDYWEDGANTAVTMLTDAGHLTADTGNLTADTTTASTWQARFRDLLASYEGFARNAGTHPDNVTGITNARALLASPDLEGTETGRTSDA